MIELTITSDMCTDEKTLNAYLKLALPNADDLDILYVTEQVMMHYEHTDRDIECYTKLGNSVIKCKILKRVNIIPDTEESKSFYSSIRRWLSVFLDVIIRK